MCVYVCVCVCVCVCEGGGVLGVLGGPDNDNVTCMRSYLST